MIQFVLHQFHLHQIILFIELSLNIILFVCFFIYSYLNVVTCH
jgi:hypothetical protein